jgi:hypothetical protein
LRVISGLMGQEIRVIILVIRGAMALVFACSPETYLLFLLIPFPISPVSASRAAAG